MYALWFFFFFFFSFPESVFKEKKMVKGLEVLATTGEFSPYLHHGMGL
jgi:hypothetical protein